MRTFLGFTPSDGPTMPSCSICSMIRAARLADFHVTLNQRYGGLPQFAD